MPLSTWLITFKKDVKTIQWGKNSLSTNDARKVGYPHTSE